jgi:hypothetical protein
MLRMFSYVGLGMFREVAVADASMILSPNMSEHSRNLSAFKQNRFGSVLIVVKEVVVRMYSRQQRFS